MTYHVDIPGQPTEITAELSETKSFYSGIDALFYIAAIILLCCAPALIIMVWKAAL